MQPVSLKSVLKRTLKSLDLYDIYRRHRALILWERVCGKDVARVTRALKLRGNVLVVGVTDHIWATELSHFSFQYLGKYSKLLGHGVVSEIRFKPDPKLFEKSERSVKVLYDPDQVEIPRRDQGKIREITDALSDERSREYLEKILLNRLKYDRWLKKRGGSPCFSCGVMLPKGTTFCPHCSVKLEVDNLFKLRELLEDAPWTSYKEALRTITPLSLERYEETRQAMIDTLHRQLIDEVEQFGNLRRVRDESAASDREEMKSGIKLRIITYAMLVSCSVPAGLTDPVLRKYLPSALYDFYRG